MHPMPHLQMMGIGAEAANGHFPGRRGRNLEDQIELDRHDEPRRVGQLGVELTRTPAGVAGEDGRALWKRTRGQDLTQQHR
jgi:hypothetical protein